MPEPSKEAVEAMVAQGRWPAEMERLLEAALPIERNRWEQEVRERLERCLDKQATGVLELAQKAFANDEAVRARKLEDDAAVTRNVKALLLDSIFGEAEPVKGRTDV